MDYWQSSPGAGGFPERVRATPDSAITIGFWRNLEGGETTQARGVGLDWRLDVVMCNAWDESDAAPIGQAPRPALVFRPLHFYAVDHRKLTSLFRIWLSDLTRTRRGSRLPTIEHEGDLIPVPHRPPWKTCLPIRHDDLLWSNFNRIYQDAHAYYEGGPKTPKLLHHLLASVPYRRLLTRSPATIEEALGQPPRTPFGRPPSYTSSSVELTLLHALITAGLEPSREAEEQAGALGPLRARFVLELCAQHRLVPHDVARAKLRWRWPPPVPEDEREEIAHRLSRAGDNLATHALEGSRRSRGDPPDVRVLAPSIVPIADLTPRPQIEPGGSSAGLYDTLLVDWLRSEHAASLLPLALDAAPEKLRMRCCAGSWDDFLSHRHRPFHRQRVFVHPDDPDYLGAIAAVPGAQPGPPLNMDITGFADDPAVLRDLWFDGPVGEVSQTHTVPASGG